MNLAAARALKSEALTAVDGDVLVTLDQSTAGPALAAGQSVVLIPPPNVTWETDYVATATWTVYLIASDAEVEDAWESLDVLTTALATIWGQPDEATPAEWIDPTGLAWPASAITITTHHDL